MPKRKPIAYESAVPAGFDAMVAGALAEESPDDSARASSVAIFTADEDALVEETPPQPFFGADRIEPMQPRGSFYESPPIVSDGSVPDAYSAPQQEPAALRPMLHPDGRDVMGFDTPQRIDSMDPLGEAMGTKFYRVSPAFDWCRQGRFNTSGPGELDSRARHTFTRWYFQVRVIVDIFSSSSAATLREIEEKSAAIYAQGSIEGAIGYLPIVRGAFVAADAIATAMRGGILPLQDVRTSSGVSA